jgi:uncharacterized protein (UPF0333 family)
MHRKGQSSLEQVLVTVFAITFIAFIFYFSMNYASDNIRLAQAKDTINKLGAAADYVYSLGPGSTTEVSISMPEGVQFINTSGNRIQIHFQLWSGESDVFFNTKASSFGTISTSSGMQAISVSLTDSGKVQFGANFLSCKKIYCGMKEATFNQIVKPIYS